MSKSAGSAPTPPKFIPVDIAKTQDLATQADIAGYDFSDKDFAARFPGLVSGREEQIGDAYKQLTGPLDPTVQNSFVNQGLQQSLGAFGGGNPTAGISKGSASGNAVATSLANNVEKKQDYDRANFENVLASNPQRTFGLSGEDVSQMTIANIIGRNNYLQAKYGGTVGNANAQTAANNQTTAAATSAAVAILGAVIAASDKRIKSEIKKEGETQSGIPIKSWVYKTDPNKKRYTGFVAQDVEKKAPQAVLTDPTSGLKLVNYSALPKGASKIKR